METAFLSEGLSALRAVKRFDARVNDLVHFKLSRCAKRLLAARTAVQLLPCMFRSLVQLQNALHGELLPTQRATKWLPVSGYNHVRSDVTLFEKELAAVRAAVPFLTSGRGLPASARVTLGPEDPPALCAADRFPPASRLILSRCIPRGPRVLLSPGRPSFACCVRVELSQCGRQSELWLTHFGAVLVIDEDSGPVTQLHRICR